MSPLAETIWEIIRTIGLFFVKMCCRRRHKGKKLKSYRPNEQPPDKEEGSETHWRYGKGEKRRKSRKRNKKSDGNDSSSESSGAKSDRNSAQITSRGKIVQEQKTDYKNVPKVEANKLPENPYLWMQRNSSGKEGRDTSSSRPLYGWNIQRIPDEESRETKSQKTSNPDGYPKSSGGNRPTDTSFVKDRPPFRIDAVLPDHAPAKVPQLVPQRNSNDGSTITSSSGSYSTTVCTEVVTDQRESGVSDLRERPSQASMGQPASQVGITSQGHSQVNTDQASSGSHSPRGQSATTTDLDYSNSTNVPWYIS